MTEFTEDPLEGIRHENEVTSRLLDRLQEAARKLRSDPGTSGEEILSALSRLEEYHHQLHGSELRDGLIPEARSVMMDSCASHLDGISRHYVEDGEALKSLREIVANHAYDDPASRRELADLLEQIVAAERSELAHETDYPLSCLETVLPDDARERLSTLRERQRRRRADIERTVGA
ncbi:MAG: hypothetical protein M1144_00185 [Candidatus Thermoplasmatota archaeon]|nr:hypothetical protein [Candidatus Thermoplasmatota archaeon]MCL5984183.1 hypothetical protein [Candidatus Thermoplasmatota archaeon]